MVILGALLFFVSQAGCLELKTGVHIHTKFSHGNMQAPEQVAARAREKGLDAIIITDTLIARWDYGLRPFENVLRVAGWQSSILAKGPRRYLRKIAKLRRDYPELVIIPGAEAAAYYRWSGDPLKRLEMWDWNRHMLIFGLEKPADYERMPVMGNSASYPWDWKLLSAAALLFAGLWLSWRRLGPKARIAAMLAAGAGLYLLYPFAVPRWSVYSDKTPWGPYRALAAYAHERGALAFWAHPEAPNWNPPQHFKGPLYVAGDLYPDALAEVPDADGFAVFMEGYKLGLEPGGPWDKALLSYVSGGRARPPWALSELDYVSPGYMGTDIDTAYMLVSADGRTPQGLLQGLRRGSFQSVLGSDMGAMRFSRWEMRSAPGGKAVGAGGELELSSDARLELGLEKSSGTVTGAEMIVVCDGKELARRSGPLPSSWSLKYSPSAARGYCRAYARQTNSMVSSNPIFYRKAGK